MTLRKTVVAVVTPTGCQHVTACIVVADGGHITQTSTLSGCTAVCLALSGTGEELVDVGIVVDACTCQRLIIVLALVVEDAGADSVLAKRVVVFQTNVKLVDPVVAVGKRQLRVGSVDQRAVFIIGGDVARPVLVA